MITSQKIKLLINDPKFRQVKQWNSNSLQQALNKIYANQKKLHRSKVVQQCLVKKDYTQNVDTTVDFLQCKIHAIDQKIVQDVQKTLLQKQKIQQKYRQLQDIYQKSKKKYIQLINSISEQKNYDQNLENLQKQVNQIKQLYEENTFLKNMNNQIKRRIRQKQQKYKISTPKAQDI